MFIMHTDNFYRGGMFTLVLPSLTAERRCLCSHKNHNLSYLPGVMYILPYSCVFYFIIKITYYAEFERT